MIVAKLECLFSTKTERMTSLTWHVDWLIQLLTNLFSLHLFPSDDGDHWSLMNNCWFQWILHYRRISQGMLSIVNVHCWKMPVDFYGRCKAGMFVFYETLETSRIALITWHCDWLIQLLTDLFSLHFFSKQYDEDYWSYTKDGWFQRIMHISSDIIGNAFDCECSLLKNAAVDFTIVAKPEHFYNSQGFLTHNVVSSVSKR